MINLGRKNLQFTLTIVPDNGYDVKSGNINSRFIVSIFSVMIAAFFVCLFFVIGFHVKAGQEYDFNTALTSLDHHIRALGDHERFLSGLEEKLLSVRKTDEAMRLFVNMPVPDSDMYLAGVGGHVIVDNEPYNGIGNDLEVLLDRLMHFQKSLDRQLLVAHNSLRSVRGTLLRQQDIINYTPSSFPTYSFQITSPFGMRRNPVTGARQFHDAVDFGGKRGDLIYATANGTVIATRYHEYRGNYIEIRHKYGYSTLYAHLDTMSVVVGQEVKKDDVIGTMGRSGRTTGVNLHYSVTCNNRKENPVDYL